MTKNFIIFVVAVLLFAPAALTKDCEINPNQKLAYVNMDFWSKFEDEYLCYYIKKAVECNHNARKASYKVEEYRQNIKLSLSRELPMLSAGAYYFGIQVPEINMPSNLELQANSFLLPLIANYEADFLLKNRDRTRAQKKKYEAELFEEKAVYIALISDVAATYINVIRFDKLIDVQSKLLENHIEIHRKTQLRLNEGLSSKIELNNASKNIYDAKNDLLELENARANSLYQLAVLTGHSPELICELERTDFDRFGNKYAPPDAICSEVIFARPDVQAVEKKLEKANIDIRIARKEFLPRFNITGFLIFNTITPGSFFNWDASIATLLAGASQDVFMGGRKIANLKIKKLQYQQIFEEYRQTDLMAIKEVINSLYLIKNNTKIFENELIKLATETENFKISQIQFQQGTLSHMDMLSKENIVLCNNKSLINRKAVKLIDYVTLYKAAGANL